MAEDVTLNYEPSNPCCLKWHEKYTKLKERYSKLEEGRNALRKGLSIFEQQIGKMQAENLSLKKAYEDERGRASSEKENSANETAKRVALEKEVATLKSEILSLKQNGGLVARDLDEEKASLRGRISEIGRERNMLKELLEKERTRADVEQKKYEKEKKKADEANKKVKAEKSRANEEKRLADIARKKAEEFRHQVETLKCKADEAVSKLALETAKCEEANEKLNAERERTTIERKRANLEMVKVEEQRKAAEANMKKAMDERSRADNLSQQLDRTSQRLTELEKEIHALVNSRRVVGFPMDQPIKQPSAGILELAGDICSGEKRKEFNGEEACKRLEKVERKMRRGKKQAHSEREKAEEQNQVAEAYNKATMEVKHHELECYKRGLEAVQDEIQKLISCRAIVLPSPVSDRSLRAENAEMKLIRKQLKFEKRRAKHAKKVAKMEMDHNRVLRQEVLQLKQVLIQFSQRLDTLDDCLLRSYGGMNGTEKVGKLNLEQEYFCVEPCQRNLQDGDVLRKPSCTRSTSTGGSLPLMQSTVCAASLAPISGPIYMRSNAGIDSELEPLLRDCKRKMLKSSTLSFSSASFSDRPLVGSQERGDLSLSTSPKLQGEMENLEPALSGLSSDTKKSYNAKLALGAENSVGSPIRYAAAERTGNCQKKRRLLHTVGPLGYLSSLHSQRDKSLEEERLLLANLQSSMHGRKVGPYRKRKASIGNVVDEENFYESSEPNTGLETSGIELTDVSNHASPNVGNLTNTVHVKDGIGDLLGSNIHGLSKSFVELVDGDYMKLLDLDNDVDEERYKKAIERPLSPTLPQIEFRSKEAPEIGSNTPLSTKCSYERFSNGEDNPETSCSFDVINLESDSNMQALHEVGASKISSSQEEKYSNTTCKHSDKKENSGSNLVRDSSPSRLICNSGMRYSVSRTHDSVIPCQSSGAPTIARPQKYIVVETSNHDNNLSFLKIFSIANNFMEFSTKISSDVFMQNTLSMLKKADDLSAKERVCVFVSMLLHHISEILEEHCGEDFEWDLIGLIASFAQQMCAVLSNLHMRTMFMELCDMHELFALTEDFLLNKRILVYDHVSDETIPGCDSRPVPVVLDSCLLFSTQVASPHLLVAGGVFLASICAATGQIGILCEVSCNIFRMQKNNSSLVLRLLHIFAYLCGSKYFNLEDYGLEMSVLKSLVVFLEKLNSRTDSTACLASVLGPSSMDSFFTKCPFLEDASSVDSVVKLLLEKLQQYALSAARHQIPREASYLSNSEGQGTEKASDHGEAVLLNIVSNENLFHCIDILSLLELVACLVSWDWTFGNIILRLQQMLESCIVVHLSAAIITLLGQLGRLGVDAEGYEDSGVDSLREWLSAFLGQSISRNFGLPIQFACAKALVGLIAKPFQEVVESNFNLPVAANQSVAAYFVKKWFSSLSTEQQSSFMLLSFSDCHSCMTGNPANGVAC